MTSTIGVKKIQYPNGTDILTLDSSGSVTLGDAATVTGAANLSSTLNVTGTSTTAQIDASGSINTTANTISVTNSSYPQLQLNSGVKNYHIFNDTGSNSLYFKNNTDNVNAMVVNPSGHLTLSTQPSCLVKKNGNLSAPQNSAFSVTGWTSVHDVGSMFNSGNSRITVPTAGSYIVGAALQTSGVTGLHIAILKNDTAIGTDSYLNIIDGGAIAMSICVTASANDYFTVSAYVTHSGLNIQGNRSKFWAVKVA